MKKFSFLIFSSLLLLPVLAQAHEKWFVKNLPPYAVKPLLFTSWNSTNASLVLLAVFGLVVALLLHFALRPHRFAKRIRAELARYSAWIPSLLRVLTGTVLFMASFSQFIFAPDLMTDILPITVARVLLAIELVAGLGLIVGFFPRWMSLIGFTLYLVTFFIFPTINVLTYLNFVGIFFYLFIIGDPALPKVRGAKLFNHINTVIHFDDLKPYATAVLRILTGLSFVILGFMYKIYEPQYAVEFLKIHPINFMPALGFVNFDNDMFVLAAGLTEMLAGVLLIFGLLPRFVGGLLIALFTITLLMFGIYELLGHLPLYAAAIAFLLQGGGEKWSAEMPKKRFMAR